MILAFGKSLISSAESEIPPSPAPIIAIFGAKLDLASVGVGATRLEVARATPLAPISLSSFLRLKVCVSIVFPPFIYRISYDYSDIQKKEV